jgi:hypothetical protein
MSPSSDHGAVEGMGWCKILCLCQSQFKLPGLKGNACCDQIREKGRGQHANHCRKNGHDAAAARNGKRHEMA